MRSLLVLLFLTAGFAYGQTPAADPSTLTINPNGNTIAPVCGVGGGDLLGESGGQLFRYTAAWPSYESPCLLYGLDQTQVGVINANAVGPPATACDPVLMDNVTYNAGSSNLANGVVVFTGTTDYYFQLTTSAWAIQNRPVRMTVTFTQAGTATPIPAIASGSKIYIPADQDFDMLVYIEAAAPTLSASYCTGTTAGAYYGCIELFDRLMTDFNQQICTSFTPGSFFETIVTATASNTGPVIAGNPVDLNSSGTGVGTLTYAWTGPSSYGTQNVNIPSATQPDSGMYYITITDDFGCTNLDSTLLIVVTDSDGDGCPDDIDPNPLVFSADGDGDGYGADCDCNDADPAINPGATEIACNGIDDDCNAGTPDDGVLPNAVCQNITVFLNGAGTATITAGDVDGGSSDNCGIAGMSVSPAVFTCADIGANNVTLTVTDSEGNSANCVAIVTVADTVSPIAVCQNITVFLDGAGSATITAADIDGGSTDNCGGVTLAASQTAFTCSDIGANSVTLTVTDANGNTDACTATVTIADTTSPTAVCQNITFFLDGSGSATITAADIDGGSTDNCGGVTLAASQTAFTCADIGANAVTLTVMDASGNTDVCSATVTIADTTSPNAVCQNLTVFLDGSGNATITGLDVDNGSTDNCGIVSYSVSPSAFTCADVGANSVTLTVMDANGNTDACTATVTIADTTSPTAVCQNITVFLDGAGSATITAADIDGGSTDNCGGLTLAASQTAFTCADIGANAVTLTVMDASGNTDVCSATVTVADTTSPTAVCQNISVYLNGAGTATILTGDIDAGSTDNCSLGGMSVSPAVFTCADIGANNVTLTVFDSNGNTDACSATVTIIDTISPTAICQNITLYLNGAGTAPLIASDLDGGSTDNCGPLSFGASVLAFTCANVGANNVTMTVTDASGNSDACNAIVTVVDTISPTAVCQNVTVYLDGAGNATITAGDVDGGSSDNCGIAGMSVSPSSFTCADIGANNVTLTVTDNSGNSDACSATVTVLDTVSPTAVCQNITVYLDGAGNASIVAADIDGGSTDNCGAVTLSASATSFTCTEVGANNITLTVTDAAGNSDACTAVVTVMDTVSPTAVCQNITIYVDGSGNATLAAADIDGGSTDNCGAVTLASSATMFSCADLGANNVTLTVTDASGNSDACNAIVTVVDTISPTALCQDVTVYLDGSGNVSIVASDIDGGSTDNCSAVTLAASLTAFTCAEVGPNNVTLTVTDAAGNMSTCVAVVTVADTVDPIAVCQNITVYLDGTGNATITAADIDGGSTDNCGAVTLGASMTAFTCAEVGANNVTLTVTDGYGNSDMCTAVVTVADTVSPTAVCQNITVYLDGTGNVNIAAADIDGGSTDNCGAITLGASMTAFSCTEIGANNVTLTVTDSYGNTDNCTAVVTVMDTVSPAAVCQDVTIYLDGTGNAIITAADIDGGSTDNCAVISLSASMTDFTCTEIGANNVTLTVTDGAGNTDVCTAVVTVMDTVSPTAICQDVTVYLDGTGNASIIAADVDGGSIDNCGVTLITASPTNFTCAEEGANNVTLIVSDAAGNLDSCVAVVTVIDTIAPTVVCQDLTVYVDGTGYAIITASDIDGGSSDNCGSVLLISSMTDFSCTEVGDNNVTLYATDVSGNIDSCTAVVTVIDTISPTAVCQDITVQLDGSGYAPIIATDVEAGSFDNCSVVNWSIAETGFTCDNIGTNSVVLTVEDGSGNQSQCTAFIEVIDVTSPIIFCPSDDVDTTDYSCALSIPDYTSQVVITDECDSNVVNIWQFPTADSLVTADNISIDGTSGVIMMTVYAEDASGNMVSCDFSLYVICQEDLMIPGFFSPNGDGKNEFFEISGLAGYETNSIIIFNRWGNEVFQMDNYDNTWDGKSNGPMTIGDGQLPVGTYFYVLRLDGGDEVYQGYVELRR